MNDDSEPKVTRPPGPWWLAADWLRRLLTRRGLWERRWAVLGLALLLVGSFALAANARRLAPWQQAGAGVTLILVVGLAFRVGGGGRLFGPVLFYDLVRTARRGRTFLLRCIYTFALLLVLFLLYVKHAGRTGLFDVVHVRESELKDLAETFFSLFMLVQFGAVLLLTPAYTATAVTEERERGTLDDLLTTDLSGREIVVGKLVSRLLTLLLLLVSGLPILGFLQFLGGVDPDMVIAGFVGTVVTLFSLGSLGLLASVLARSPRTALVNTYALAVGYLLLTGTCAATPPGRTFGPLDWTAAGNVFVAYVRLRGTAAGPLPGMVWTVLTQYVTFHGLVGLTCLVLASLKLRPAGRAEKDAPPPSPFRFDVPPGMPVPPLAVFFRPRIGDHPVLWREMHVERIGSLPAWLQWILLLVAAVAAFGAGAVFLAGVVVSLAYGDLSEFACKWVQYVGTPVACLMLLIVAVRAATTLSTERDRQTLDSLLTTPLETSTLLAHKVLASMLAVRQGWWVLGSTWLLGLLAGGLHPLSLLALFIAWWAYAAFAALLGLWFSLACRSTLRAVVWTLATLLLVGSGWPLFGVCCLPPTLIVRDLVGLDPTIAQDFYLYGLTPPGALLYLTFPVGDWYTFATATRQAFNRIGMAWVGVCLYALTAASLWGLVNWRFARVTGRMRE